MTFAIESPTRITENPGELAAEASEFVNVRFHTDSGARASRLEVPHGLNKSLLDGPVSQIRLWCQIPGYLKCTSQRSSMVFTATSRLQASCPASKVALANKVSLGQQSVSLDEMCGTGRSRESICLKGIAVSLAGVQHMH